ncbi:MAG: biosynthetic arginine decarboxylase [Bacteriovoracaceae bacterium]|nr:biosynthetic arginine decarboxylase [Bacteriovoracaceae bacterium]
MNSSNWSVEDAVNEYQILRWGDGYFTVNAEGELCASPSQDPNGHKISLAEIIKEMKDENIAFPCVIRFHDILRSQVRNINKLFAKTIEEAKFDGKYMGVYPIKVNQLREVVEEVVDAGLEFSYGLEAGSKAELMTVLTYNQNPKALTILNGYKDKDYMRLALLGQQIGRNMVVVIEKFSEIHLLLEVIKETGVVPMIGVRAKLTSKASGKWADSSGEFAKFGLSVPEIIDLIELLKEKELLHALNLFHFHVGSQIPDIRTIKECLTEGARIYCELIKLGAPIEYFDVGGGVGINYDGSRSNQPSSTNYALADYVGDVVYILRDICNDSGVKHPSIVNEAGRVITAHHSCVVTNVFGNVELAKPKDISTESNPEDHLLLRNIKHLYRELNHSNYQDVYNDACIIKDEAVSAFKLGVIGIIERSQIEGLYWNICHQTLSMTENEKYVPGEIKKLKFVLADKYLCNFSVFQSTPDSWAINQILPVVPLKKLNEAPTKECTLADITCDSDGKIAQFLGPDGHQPTLALHQLEKGEEYPIGVFLTGAYQDVMGDMHNLFGRLNEVHVYGDQDDPKGFYIEEFIHGNSAAEVLRVMQYNPEEMCKKIKSEIDKRVKTGSIKPRVGVKLTDFFEAKIKDYTYLSSF